MARYHLILVDADALADATHNAEVMDRRLVARQIGEAIIDRCVGVTNPLLKSGLEPLALAKQADALEVAAMWMSNDTKVFLWNRRKPDRARLTLMEKLADADFRLLQHYVLEEIGKRNEAIEVDADLKDEI